MRGRLRKLGLGRGADDEGSSVAGADTPAKKKKKAVAASKKKKAKAKTAVTVTRDSERPASPEDDRPPEHESTGPKALREIATEDLEGILEAHREWITSKSTQWHAGGVIENEPARGLSSGRPAARCRPA